MDQNVPSYVNYSYSSPLFFPERLRAVSPLPQAFILNRVQMAYPEASGNWDSEFHFFFVTTQELKYSKIQTFALVGTYSTELEQSQFIAVNRKISYQTQGEIILTIEYSLYSRYPGLIQTDQVSGCLLNKFLCKLLWPRCCGVPKPHPMASSWVYPQTQQINRSPERGLS